MGFQDGSSRTCLLSWLIRGCDHHCVADGERNEEVENVRQLGREVVQRVLLMPRGGQAPATLAHLLQQLGVRRYVLLLRRTQRPGVSLIQASTQYSLGQVGSVLIRYTLSSHLPLHKSSLVAP